MKKQISLFNLLNKDAHKVSGELLEKILEANALFADFELNNQILKELVCNYAALEKKNYELLTELKAKNETIIKDLSAASTIQKSLLPQNLPEIENYRFTWECLQCDLVGGDLVNVFLFDNDNLVFYIVDVSGHGPQAAMITVALSQALRPYGPQSKRRNFLSPSDILAELELEFPFERFNSFFTIVYGVLNHKTGKCKICNSAHPYPFLADSDGAKLLESSNPMIGLGLADKWVETEINLDSKQKLFLYTDGVIECRNTNNEDFGETRLLNTYSELCMQEQPDILADINKTVKGFCNGREFADDYSLLLIEKQ
jgi:sigma-B regulation protein RsbU (phosphoserine phosphatase)